MIMTFVYSGLIRGIRGSSGYNSRRIQAQDGRQLCTVLPPTAAMASLHPNSAQRPQVRGPFRPASQYPADPYSQASSPATSERSSRPHRRAPWTLDLDALETLTTETPRSVILILGGRSFLVHLGPR